MGELDYRKAGSELSPQIQRLRVQPHMAAEAFLTGSHRDGFFRVLQPVHSSTILFLCDSLSPWRFSRLGQMTCPRNTDPRTIVLVTPTTLSEPERALGGSLLPAYDGLGDNLYKSEVELPIGRWLEG